MAYYKRKMTGYSQQAGRRVKKTYKLKRTGRKSGRKARMNIHRMVNKILARKMETKSSTSTITDGTVSS